MSCTCDMPKSPQFTRFRYRKSSLFGNSTPTLCELAGFISTVLLLNRNSSVLSPPSFSLIRGLLGNSKLKYIAGEMPLEFSQVKVVVN
ncbi:hypothetical protein TNCV_2232031 [Trichonephila clavipes]|nr:hypothetical protein TNCV_2232031 [Trichonephila clavipes]